MAPRAGSRTAQAGALTQAGRLIVSGPVQIDDRGPRAVWTYVERLDLTPLYDRIRARGSLAGRPAIDPCLLVAVWLYATLSGFSSAREVAYLCIHYDPFRWLAGGVSVNYHTLADFRTDNPELVEQLLKQSVE